MDGGVVTFTVAIIIVAVFVFIAIGLTGKRGHKFNIEDYQAKFLAIENKLNPSPLRKSGTSSCCQKRSYC